MNPNDMTAQQAADWCAKDDEWNYEPAQVDGLGATAHYWWRYTIHAAHGGRTYASVHPHPPTLDGAAAALPEGWAWWKDATDWIAQAPHSEFVYVRDTGDETADRYRLAVLCRLAAKEQA